LVTYLGRSFIVEEQTAFFHEELFQYRYLLTKEKGLLQPKHHNQRLKGVSLLGRVIDRQNSEVKLHLDIDQRQEIETTRWLPFASQGNNVFYCMPELGEKVSLYFQRGEESSSIAVNAVRANGNNCAKTSDPSVKYMGIPSGQEFMLSPSNLDFTERAGLSLSLEEGKGITGLSHKHLIVHAKGRILLRAMKEVLITAQKGPFHIEAGPNGKSSQIHMDGGIAGNTTIFTTG